MRQPRSSLLPALATATMLVGASLLESLAGGAPVPLPAPSAFDSLPQSQVAEAVRACDLAGAESALSALATETNPAASPISRDLILGLAAESCGEHSPSLDWLRASPADSEFDDWRLYGIARSSIELGQFPLAKAALDSLRHSHPNSPLFAEAILSAAELAQERGDLLGLAELARQNRAWGLSPDDAEVLEVAAWHAGVELKKEAIRREVAIRLLIKHPVTASQLKVIEEFRAHDGSLDWLGFMTREQLLDRAGSLMRVGLHKSAMDTLELIPEPVRDLDWRLAAARALTASYRGEEALVALEGVDALAPSQESKAEWRRAFAALEVSKARPGRTLNLQQRTMMRERAHRHLERVIALGLEPERSKRALRLLFEDALDEDRFEDAVAILRRLKTTHPKDTTGARPLWQYGWKQHQLRNYSGAIGYWAELSALYPTSTYTRGGLYWAARSYEELGNRARSQQLLQEVADVPWTDFYSRQALRRLGRSIHDDIEDGAPTEPWPRDLQLRRAEWLGAWGLDRAALLEVDGLGDRADLRAASALKSLLLSSSGEWRKSIIEIKRVYPLLGSSFQGLAPERARYLYYPLAFDQIIEQNASRNGLDRNLVLAMIRQESAFDAGAHSHAGARGLMQVMPATGREIAGRLGLSYSKARLSDPSFSIRIGTTYYRQVRSMFDDDEELALAGYNAGPYRIKRLWRAAGTNAEVDRFLETLQLEETKSYVKRVLLFADSYRRLYPATTSGGEEVSQPAAS